MSSHRFAVPIGALALAGAVGVGIAASTMITSKSRGGQNALEAGVQTQATSLQDSYINMAAPLAQRVSHEYNGVPASVTIAQSAIESNWGRSRLTVNDRDYFGFKCVAAGQPGPLATGCHDYVTHEDNPPRDIHAYFRVYPSQLNSFRDYGRLMNTPGYAGALRYKGDPNGFIRAIAHRYSTNPNYANQVIATMRAHNLYRFDGGAPAPPPAGGRHWVRTFAAATGYSGAGPANPQGILNAGTNYVYCKVWGAEVRNGNQYNHWWLRTDLDRTYPGKNGRDAYVSAYYLTKWGNDQAKDINGADIPNCSGAPQPAPPPPSGPAPSGQNIANLAAANVGKKACDTNSRGGRAYGSSCTGNGGQPEYWCADFARWVWGNAGVADLAGLTPAARSFYAYGQSHGTLSGRPAVGDAVVFSNRAGDTSADAGGIHHVAIVSRVNPNGTIETISGDWGGENGSQAHFASTSHVVANTPAYGSAVGSYSTTMKMWIQGYVAPSGGGGPVTPPPPAGGKHWVRTFAAATGYSGAGPANPQGILNAGTNYVYCKVWGAEVRNGNQYNHWWLRTDLDRTYPGKNGRGAYVSAYYLTTWGNDQAKDINGADIPNC